jgi:prepilin-type N-terminal cleavage/methylation domain-containing protein
MPVLKTTSAPQRPLDSQPRLGFSLIELLAGIALIAILAALLLPTLASTKAKGQQMRCLANMQQIMRATHLYANDFDNYLPFCGAFPPPVPDGYSNCWAYRWSPSGNHPEQGQLWPYHQSLALLLCPWENTNAAYFKPRFGLRYQAVTSYNFSTSAAGFPAVREGPDGWNKGVGLKLNPFRADGILAWEPPETLLYVLDDGVAEPFQYCTTRHNGGGIVGCYGGGAEHMTYKAFFVEEKRKPGRLWCKPNSPTGD